MCCDDMRNWSSDHCTEYPFDCPDRLVYYSEKRNHFGIIIHDGGGSFVKIRYCPWCGKALSVKPEDEEPDHMSED